MATFQKFDKPKRPPVTSEILDRQPPCNVEAEHCVLGSILILPDVLDEIAVRLQLRPEDFYDDANRILYEHMLELHDSGKKIDVTLLIDALERKDEFQKIGGPSHLARVTNSVPNAAHAVYYGQIVRKKATYRSLIGASTEILREAYDEDGEADDLLAQAEQKIFAILDGRGSNEVSNIRDVLHVAMDRIDARMKGEHTTGGVMTDYTDLDALTGGLHNSELVVLAARPSMGKTALALNITENVAVHQQVPVLFVSLEMSSVELADRLLSSAAMVNSERMRSGTLSGEDRKQLVETADKIYAAPLYIDDSPARRVNEIAAAARRIKRREGRLGLIVIDYLQLVEPENPKDPRQEQVSRMTRRLKGLAREMEVPILCLAQLNRQAEQSKDNIPRLSHLRECVVGSTLVQLEDGSRVPISELVGQQPRVLSINDDGQITSAQSDAVWNVGRRPVFDVRLASGRSIRATAEHRLYAAGGWRTVAELATGDRLGIARFIPEPIDTISWPDARVGLLGQLIGDGSFLKGQPMRYCTASEDNSEFVATAARDEFGCVVCRYAGRRSWHQLLISGNGNRWKPAGVNKWLRDLGIFGQRSYEKRVPREVFRLSNKQIATFLSHLWATDGCIFTRRPGDRGSHSVYYSTNSPGLAADVAALLLRMQIVSRTYQATKAGFKPSFHVSVTGVENQRRFLESVSAFGPRTDDALRLAETLSTLEATTNVDTVPNEYFDRVRALMREQGISHRKMSDLRGTSHGGGAHFKFAPSRSVIAEYAEHLDDDPLRKLAVNDIFWDRIVEITPAGEEDVYDLTVPAHANWLADGIITHNSGAIEQDADVVMFVHREEYYHRGEERQQHAGDADIIIGKQRNGPIGDVKLLFHKHFTKFVNPAPERYNEFDDFNASAPAGGAEF